MDGKTVLVFTHNGLGHGPDELQLKLADKFLGLITGAGTLPAKILFYTDGVKLACAGSPVLPHLQSVEARGVELIICKTCLDYLGLTDKVQVGIVGGMPDIIQAMQDAAKVISL
jgi:sulfur relay (sulfurtransferase) complex TusBCD TusD component (DsrE family)